MVLQNRRKFLQKALGVGAIAVASAATAAKLNVNENPVPQGKSKKQEVLYHKPPLWEQYYKIAY